jgi:hypothetical protein
MRRFFLDLANAAPSRIQRLLGPLIAVGKRSHREELDLRHAGILVSRRRIKNNSSSNTFPTDEKIIETMHLYELQKKLSEYVINNINNISSLTKVSTSSIPNAGKGVFVNQDILAGDLITIYPGRVFTPQQVLRLLETKNEIYDKVFVQDSNWCVQCFDGTIIDARFPINRDNQFIKLGCVGHLINHPPPQFRPNVLKTPFEFNLESKPDVIKICNTWKNDDDEDHEKNDNNNNRIGNNFVLSPSSSKQNNQLKLKGIAFIATRNISQGQELFVNYRYNPKLTLPSWYTPVDDEEDSERWAKG